MDHKSTITTFYNFHKYLNRPNQKDYHNTMTKTIRKAFKFRLNTTPDIHDKLNHYVEECRFAWNKSLALNLDRLNNGQSIMWYMEVPHQSTSIMGIDMGIKQFATLSNGMVYKPLNSFKGKSEKLAKLQKQLKHKKKFSNHWKQTKAKITKCHEEIVNARKDYPHKVSSEICENQAVIIVEDLKIKNMSQSAKGSLEKPGKKIAQKSGLNQSILDQGWGLFFQMLEYKQNWNGGMVIKAPAHHTSQTCPCCQHVAKENRLTQADFQCIECGYSNNADIVGAINVLSRGHRQLACEVSGAVMPPTAGTCEKRQRKLAPEKSGITASLGR